MAFDSMDSPSQSLVYTKWFLDCVERIFSPALQRPFGTWRKVFRLALSGWAVAAVLLLAVVSTAQEQRHFTVRDSIEKVTFVVDASNGKEVTRFSPDGRH